MLAVAAVSAIQVGPASAAAPLQPRPTAAEPPTDRVIEQVSPVDKGGNSIRHVWRVAESEDGGVLFSAMGPFAGVQGSTTNTFYRARRGAHGWETVGLQPRPLEGILHNSSTFQYFDGADAQLDAAVIHTQYPYVQEAVRPNGLLRNNVYLAGADGAFSWLSRGALAPNGVLEHAHVAAVSPAGPVLVVGTTSPAGGGGGRLYVSDGERTVPVDVEPDGTQVPGDAFLAGATTMSDDGQTVVFSGSRLYVRRDALRPNASTIDPSRSRRTGDPAGTECPGLGFVGMSADGRRLLLTCGTPLTDDAPANGTGLYEYDPVDDGLRYRFPVPSGGPDRVLGADRDLRRIHMSGSGGSLWFVDDRGVREVASDALATTEAWTSVSRDGKRLAFISDKGLDGGYAGRQMYVFDATDGPDGSLTCVSCRPGASAGGQALFGTGDIPDPSLRDGAMRESFATDGSFYFMSTAALTPGAPDGPGSVYEYRDGKVRLMAAGSAEGDARFAGTSPEGTDVFVLTKQSLLPQDDDGAVQDLYSLRRGGGFPREPECPDCTPTPEDRGVPRPGLAVGSEQETSPGRGARSVAPVASAKPSVVGRQVRGTTARIRVRVRNAGTLRITGSGVRGASRRVMKSGTYTVTVRLSTYGRRVLDRRGRIALRLRVRMAPKSGVAGSTRTTLTIKQKTTRKAA